MSEQTETTRAKAQVGLFQVDNRWEKPETSGGRGKSSPIDPLLDQLKGAQQYHRQPFGIARYDKAESAKGQVASLKTRLGGPTASGFTFGVVYAKDLNQYAVTASYDPNAVTEEGKKEFEKKTAERKAAEKARRIKAEKDKAKRAEGSEGAEIEQGEVSEEAVAA